MELKDILDLFSQVTAIKNSDQILMLMANQNGTTSATKITAELLRAYLNRGFDITIGADGYFYIGGKKTNVIANSQEQIFQTDTTITIEPNVLNRWGDVTYLNVAFSNKIAVSRENEFKIQFSTPSDSPAVLILPDTVRWVDDEPLEPEPNMTYQISILNNLAVYAAWENS